MKSYRHGMANDLHIPKTNRIDSVHCISIWLLKDYKSVKSNYNSEGLTVKGSIELKIRIEAKKNIFHQRY